MTMLKRVFAGRLKLLAGTAAVAAAAIAPNAAAEKYAALVIDAGTEEVLFESFADETRYPASLTKVMTLYMVFDALKSGELTLSERMPVSANAAAQSPSKLGLKAGSTIMVSDAIKALITKSANDVAVVVGERLGGSEERFAALMTVKARLLGLTETKFYNASGLPDVRQVTTARDMAKLADAMLEDHPDYYAYFSTQKFTWGRRTYENHNVLLKDVAGVDGIKTGYTRASGFNLMTSAKRGDTRLIVIVLGGQTAKARNSNVTDLLETAYMALSIPSTGDPSQQATLRRDAFRTVDYSPGEAGVIAELEQGSAYTYDE